MILSGRKYLITALICLPVFFINIKTSHDWGDDFAQYIHQAKNITTGTPQQQTSYIYNPEFHHLGPPAYPVGFPLLLAPVYAVFGNSIKHFELCVSFFLFALVLLMFYFFRKYYSTLISILLVTVFVYNPSTLNFKMEIMSDIPFAFFMLLCVCLYQTIQPFTYIKSILLVLCLGFLISIRNIGIVFVFAIVLDGLMHLYRNPNTATLKQIYYKNSVFPFVVAVAGLSVYILLNKYIFDVTGDGIFSYNYFFDIDRLWYSVRMNLYQYMVELRFWFERPNEEWQFISFFLGSMIFAFIVLGMIKKMRDKFDFVDSLSLLYLFAILIYPNTKGGFRFLFPLAPYFLYYVVQGMRSINIQFKLRPNTVAIIMTAALLFSYKKGISDIFRDEKRVFNGPQETASREAFDYVIKNTAKDARFNFVRARAFALYTDRKCMSNRPNQTVGEIDESMSRFGIDYILINNEISEDSLMRYVRIHENDWNQIWNNSKYSLYKHNQK